MRMNTRAKPLWKKSNRCEDSYDAVYGLNAFTFDNIYTDILMRQGAIWLLVIAVLFYRLARKRNDSFNFAIVAWGIYWNYRGSRFKCVYVICDIAC